ncbi:MAG: hypothetical protein IK999_18815 [Ruminococcus sp.]|nr:hypothetical protein [Ruminococcus sp.]
MGRSLTSNHIYNAEKLTKAQFKKKFTDMMKAKGYTSAKADDGELCYALAFSGDRSWVTVLTEESTDTRKEASELAKNLGLQVLSVELVDSDFAELTLYEKSGAAADTMFLGEPYFDEYPEPSPLKWQTLLNIDWAKVEEIQSKDHTFAEEALSEFGEVIGCENMLLEFDGADDDAVRLYFKKAGEKKLTLNAAFKQVFGPELEKLGFVLAKSRYTYYVRLINKEILEVISFNQLDSDHATKRVFRIEIGVASLYRHILDLSISPKKNQDWLLDNHWICSHKEQIPLDDDYLQKIISFKCDLTDRDSMLRAFENSLEVTKKIAIPLLDKIHNIDTCIEYLRGVGIMLKLFDSTDFGNKNPNNDSNEGYLYCITPNYENIIRKKLINDLDIYKKALDKRLDGYYEDEYHRRVEKIETVVEKRVSQIERIVKNEELYAKLLSELEKRRKNNIERLKSYGVNMLTKEN